VTGVDEPVELEICALSGTLILDEDGLYDSCNFNDRLLLGLKGTMSEAELRLLKGRLRGGVLSKARRGELIQPLPVGLVYTPAGKVVLDPDGSVQQAVRHLFATFTAAGCAPVCARASSSGDRWLTPTYCDPAQPRFAGAFFYGRTSQCRLPGGKTTSVALPATSGRC